MQPDFGNDSNVWIDVVAGFDVEEGSESLLKHFGVFLIQCRVLTHLHLSHWPFRLSLQPYHGMMHSPQSFVEGVGRGTGSLITHVAAGVLSSTAAVVESATQNLAKGAAYLSGMNVA